MVDDETPDAEPTGLNAETDAVRPGWLVTLFLLVLIFLTNFLARAIMGPLLPEVENNLGLNHAQAGGLFVFVSAGYTVSIFCSSALASRLQHRFTAALSAGAVGLALVALGLGDSLWSLRGGAVRPGSGLRLLPALGHGDYHRHRPQASLGQSHRGS